MPTPRKTLFRRILEFKFLFLVNMGILVLLGLSFGREFVRNYEIKKDIALLEAQAAELATRNLELRELNTAFQTESFLEREARLKLGMKKPGEDVVIVKRREVTEEPVVGEEGEVIDPADPRYILTENPGANIDNPTKWWYYFFDRDRFSAL